MPNCVFNKKDPIILGVDVLEGIAKIGTPICIPQREFIDIGRISSIENNHKPVDIAKKGSKVAIKITGSNAEEQQKMFGRHFEMEDELVSHISRNSIDILKANYRDELSNEEWRWVDSGSTRGGTLLCRGITAFAVVAMMVFKQLLCMLTEDLSCSGRCIKVVVHELFSEFGCSFKVFVTGVAIASVGDYTV
ncbi:unnamed protein product [Lactuca saligna]|uniref:Elongation factor Tu-type domain-containing protein n=1 Tax=Lactuca saligna TaxID=75948 RepID=A0AA35VNW7_LACSI|nr:unnamed protein product [Lactuca saligna]